MGDEEGRITAKSQKTLRAAFHDILGETGFDVIMAKQITEQAEENTASCGYRLFMGVVALGIVESCSFNQSGAKLERVARQGDELLEVIVLQASGSRANAHKSAVIPAVFLHINPVYPPQERIRKQN